MDFHGLQPERQLLSHGAGRLLPPPATAVLDQGLRAYMLRVYNWMASGLLLTGIIAYRHLPYLR